MTPARCQEKTQPSPSDGRWICRRSIKKRIHRSHTCSFGAHPTAWVTWVIVGNGQYIQVACKSIFYGLHLPIYIWGHYRPSVIMHVLGKEETWWIELWPWLTVASCISSSWFHLNNFFLYSLDQINYKLPILHHISEQVSGWQRIMTWRFMIYRMYRTSRLGRIWAEFRFQYLKNHQNMSEYATLAKTRCFRKNSMFDNIKSENTIFPIRHDKFAGSGCQR